MTSHAAHFKPAMVGTASGVRVGRLRALLVPLIVYLVLGSWAAVSQGELMNTDGICYLRHAFYLAGGHWADSVSGYWSPLLIWSLAPLVGLGLDGVYAGHIAMVIWGAMLVGSGYFFMRRFTTLAAPWDMVAMILLAVKTVGWVARLVTPDIALASALLLYSGVTVDAGLLRNRKLSIAAGVLGGIAYLAKSYGLPFFIVHFTCAIALHYWFERSATSIRHAVRAWLLGVLAFAVVAGPWIAVLSFKYGRPTFSTVARVAHTVVGPADMPRAHPTDDLRPPPAGRLTVWEVPGMLPYNAWSPLSSAGYFKHQLKVVAANSGRIMQSFSSFDALHLFPAAFLLVPLLLFFRLQQRDRIFQTFWTWCAVGIYAAGFLPIFYEDRYIYSYVWPVCFLYLSDFLFGPSRPSADRGVPSLVGRWGGPALRTICVISFAVVALDELQSCLRNRSTPAWRQLAAELQRLNTPGPIAISPGSKNEGLLTAYHLSETFLGPVKGTNTAQIEASLQQHGGGTLLVRDAKWPLMETFLKETSWPRAGTFDYPGHKVYILTNPAPAHARSQRP